MILSDVLYKVSLKEVVGQTDVEVKRITSDSREVEEGSCFVAYAGVSLDGHDFIERAIASGAAVVVCENMPELLHETVQYVQVDSARKSLGIMLSNFYGNPSEGIVLVGVTGTNGKTTTATLLYELFTRLGFKCGLLSTVVNKIGEETFHSTHTTSNPEALNKLIQKMVRTGCMYCFMEVSSHAIDQDRIHGLNFDVALFSNITHDHLDYHETFRKYIDAKKKFFDELDEEAVAIVNRDDKHADVMLQNSSARKVTYGIKTMADFHLKVLESRLTGMLLKVGQQEVWTKLVGHFNASNLLAVYSIAMTLNQDELKVLTVLSELDAVSGRFQSIRSSNNIYGVVDYAHTPDALKNVLETINDVRTGNESVIVVVGCGGDRDKTKRPFMAKIAAELGTKVVLTSDNPRSEDPSQIISDMKSGVEPHTQQKIVVIPDRSQAIKTACMLAQPDDIILIAGKGHEDYQEIKGVKYPFDDMKELKTCFQMTIQ